MSILLLLSVDFRFFSSFRLYFLQKSSSIISSLRKNHKEYSSNWSEGMLASVSMSMPWSSLQITYQSHIYRSERIETISKWTPIDTRQRSNRRIISSVSLTFLIFSLNFMRISVLKVNTPYFYTGMRIIIIEIELCLKHEQHFNGVELSRWSTTQLMWSVTW